MRTGHVDPTTELRAPLGAGAGIPKKAAWISSKYDQYSEVAAQAPGRPPKLRENEEIVGYAADFNLRGLFSYNFLDVFYQTYVKLYDF